MDQSLADRGSNIIKHYGIKGMKWGVRKKPRNPTRVTVSATPGKRVKTAGGTNQRASQDAIRAAKLRQRAKKSTVDSLSNNELQDLIKRQNLEQQYSKMNPSALSRGQAVVNQLLGLGNQANQAMTQVTNFQAQARKQRK